MSSRRTTVAFAAVALGALGACSGPPATDADAGARDGGIRDANVDSPPLDGTVGCTLEIGTGIDGLVPLGPEVTVEVVNGPQGGQHVWCAVRMRGAPEEVYVDLTLRDSDGGTISTRQSCLTLAPSATAPGSTEAAGIICLLPDPQIVRAPDGGVLRMHIRARGPADRLACSPPVGAACDVSAEVEFRATWVP